MIKPIQRPRRNQFLAINNTIRSAPARQAAVWRLGFPSSTQSSHYIAAKIRVQLGGLLQNAGSSTHSSTRTSLQLIHHSQHKLTTPLRQSQVSFSNADSPTGRSLINLLFWKNDTIFSIQREKSRVFAPAAISPRRQLHIQHQTSF